MSETTALAERQEQMPATSGDDLLMAAVHKGADVETLERLMALRERMQAEQAQRAYYDALAAFQAECPTVERTKKGGQGHYAPLEVIVATIREMLHKHGLSYSFDTEHGESSVKVICRVRHRDGHSDSGSVVMPRYKGRGTNEAQDEGGAITYGRRYALCNALGIVTADSDTDGAGLGDRRNGETITEAQASALCDMAAKLNRTPDALLGWLSSKVGYDLPSIEALPASHYESAARELRALKKRAAA